MGRIDTKLYPRSLDLRPIALFFRNARKIKAGTPQGPSAKTGPSIGENIFDPSYPITSYYRLFATPTPQAQIWPKLRAHKRRQTHRSSSDSVKLKSF